jgi:Ca2+:H+ antiporter
MDTPQRSYEISRTREFLYNYWDIIFGLIFATIAWKLHTAGHSYASTGFAALAIGSLSVTVSEIAEILADRLQEPYGTFVLTFSAVGVEIIILYMLLLESTNSPDAMETVKSGIISAVIVDMNVLLGLAVFIGGLAFKEQTHNEDTSGTYTTILLVSASALLVPSVLTVINNDSEALEKASIAIAILLMVFYIVIFIFQTKTHSHFFKSTAKSRIFRIKKRVSNPEYEEIVDDSDENYVFNKLSNGMNFFMVFIFIAMIGLMAEVFATDGMVVFKENGVSVGIAGLIVAIISVTPEIFTAIKAAKNDQIQRVVNIAMGASTVSILLTVPILMLLAISSGITLNLDFNSLQIGALILTVLLAWKTTDDGETNYFEGISHLMFFLCFAVIAAFY